MHMLHGLLCATFALTACNQARAGSTIDYAVTSGRTSNVFKDPTSLPSPFTEGKLALRGTFALEESRFTYGLSASVKRIARYRFADERRVGIEAGYSSDLGEAIKFTLKGGIEHRRDGDIFLALPGLLIGYRKADVFATGSAGVTAEHWGGKTHLTATLSNLKRGNVDFTLEGLPRIQLEAGNRLAEFTGGHIRPLLGGEVGATLQYRTNHIPLDEQEQFERFPARTLRGSLAYGRAFDNGFTLMAEAGLVRIASSELSESLNPTRPFLKAELALQLPRDTVLKAKLSRDIELADIDDPLGEDVRTAGIGLEIALTEQFKLGLAYEQADSDWLYYDYRTRTASTIATLSYTLAKGATVALEYSHLKRRETDETADFKVNGLAARFSGSF